MSKKGNVNISSYAPEEEEDESLKEAALEALKAQLGDEEEEGGLKDEGMAAGELGNEVRGSYADNKAKTEALKSAGMGRLLRVCLSTNT